MGKYDELKMQSDAFTELWNTRPDLRGRLFTINNNSENAIKGALNKASGVLPGVSDQAFICRDGKTVWFEWKTPDGIQSPAQEAWDTLVTKLGHTYVIVRSEEEFFRAIEFFE